MVASSNTTLERGQHGLDSAEEATQIMQVISERVAEIAAKILHLTEQNGQIAGIVNTVDGIAEQSNLLAVNASIEASKAGEQGRGFAVVAAEVRKLSEPSKRSTRQIRENLDGIRKATQSAVMATEEGNKRTEDGVQVIETVRTVIGELASVLGENSDKTRQIAGAAAQQAAGVQQIAQAIESVSQASGDSTAGAQESQRSSHELTALAGQLEALAGNTPFLLEEMPPPAAGRTHCRSCWARHGRLYGTEGMTHRKGVVVVKR